MSKPKVLLIAGSPRGGTTITSMVLGQHPSVFANGNLSDFPHGGGMFDQSNICSCGEPASNCPFWSEVRSRYQPFEGLPDSEKIPHLFRIVSELSGREFVGDVTHNRQYAEQLINTPGIDLYLIHVVRDGRGVVYSRIRKDYRAGRLSRYGWHHLRRVVAVSRHWSRHRRQFGKLERVLGRKAVRVSYGELCGDPAAALRPIGECLGLDFSAIGLRLGEGQPIKPVPHLIRGNPRLRIEVDVVLGCDTAFRSKMRLLDRITFWIASRLG